MIGCVSVNSTAEFNKILLYQHDAPLNPSPNSNANLVSLSWTISFSAPGYSQCLDVIYDLNLSSTKVYMVAGIHLSITNFVIGTFDT